MDGIIQTTKYVKFIKGTSTAYANLSTKDPDTLYFISDNDTNGLLYLGTKLIGDGSSSDLGNVVLNSLEDEQILAYDADNNQWVNTDVESIIRIMVGATESAAGLSGLVPVPQAGDQSKFLRGDGTWASVSIGIDKVDSNVFETTTDGNLSLVGFSDAAVGSILQKDDSGKVSWATPVSLVDAINKDNEDPILTKSEVQSLISDSNHLKRAIVTSTDDMTDVNTIYMMLNGTSTVGNLYNEYMVLEDGDGNKSTELLAVNSGNVDLTNYVTKTQFLDEVGDVTLLTHTGDIVTQINDIQEKLTWGELQ